MGTAVLVIDRLVGGAITVSPITTPTSGHADTWVKFSENDTWHDYDIEGTMDISALIAAGLMPEGSETQIMPQWTTQPYAIEIGTDVTSIGEYVFYNCESLTSVIIPDSVTSIGESAFGVCSSLTNVTIPNSVTTIGTEAFYGCEGLSSVDIPNGVTSIGYNAFCLCSGLTSVTIYKTKSQVESMANKYWSLGVRYDYELDEEITFPVTIHCNDNQDIVINPAS